jgi:translation initiation factor 2B subunit (eIF-2B alpha/beta/delta family)
MTLRSIADGITNTPSRSPLSSQNRLPELPPSQPLPVTDETDEFDAVLEAAVHELENDSNSCARQIADASLGYLAHVTDIAACFATSWGEFWAMMIHAAKKLSRARPRMSAAISSCLLRALEKIARIWNEEQANGSRGTSELARIAGGTFDEIVRQRKELNSRPGQIFAQWLRENMEANQPLSGSQSTAPIDSDAQIKSRTTIRVMTLSNSNTIQATIVHALEALPDLAINLTILESRPRCEGADMASQIISAVGDKSRLLIHIVPDCAVGTASQDIDIVLLGAERIHPTGDVSNKIGSLSAALCVKNLNERAKVVVISDVDHVGAAGLDDVAETHPVSELTSAWSPVSRNQLAGSRNVDVFSEWSESVPARLIDIYVTELGILASADVAKLAREIKELDDYIFQEKIE